MSVESKGLITARFLYQRICLFAPHTHVTNFHSPHESMNGLKTTARGSFKLLYTVCGLLYGIYNINISLPIAHTERGVNDLFPIYSWKSDKCMQNTVKSEVLFCVQRSATIRIYKKVSLPIQLYLYFECYQLHIVTCILSRRSTCFL